MLFQRIFDDYFQPPSVVSCAPSTASVASIPVDTACTPSSISVDQDAPFGSTSLTPMDSHEPILHQDVKNDEFRGILKNKARLVAKGFCQEEGINFEEAFVLVVEEGSLWLKAGSSCLIFVDDIIFASTDPALCDVIAKIMISKFKMSMMGKMSFFLGLQISQSPRGIFINQSKYALKIIKKYGMESSDSVDTLIMDRTKLDEDLQGIPIDPIPWQRLPKSTYMKLNGSFDT
uniref:Retrovirus-related Pol polyprotein from transposon TNT 1-94 n=1 Tax=Tanacetum cinerariifolium TaxID=118510 RepID=A0A6L2LTS3_TANCI|nr:retrovirus-related Pol polyprotein from transposon TNT 1-94 [Tanacetum cinerariifolium]